MSAEARIAAPDPQAGLSKGERTAQRILDAAEQLFAERGYEGATLRQVARVVGLQEPAIYNHFAGKEALYCAVLERGLQPMADALDLALDGERSLTDMARLPEAMTDLLAAHPHMPALFQQALTAPDSQRTAAAQQMMDAWLDQLFARGEEAVGVMRGADSPAQDQAVRRQRVIRMMAMFNLCCGYFLCQRVLDRSQLGPVLAADNLAEQKRMLGKIIRLFILED